jgi:AcrR family transcriptional regulator
MINAKRITPMRAGAGLRKPVKLSGQKSSVAKVVQRPTDHASFMTKIPSTRRARRKQEVRDRILNAAIELFDEQSCEITHIDQICDRADVARTTLYNYFPSKQHLIVAVTDRVMLDEARRLVEEAREQSADTIERICFYIDATAAMRRKSANLKRALIRETMKAVARDESGGARNWFHLGNLLTALIKEGQARGHVTRETSAEFLGELLAGSINAISLSWSYNAKYPVGLRLEELKKTFVLLLKP